MGDFAATMGVARAPIAPPIEFPHRLWGAATHDHATAIAMPPMLTALAVTTRDGDRFVFVSADVCEWNRSDDEQAVRSAIASATGLEPADVLLHATHTHSAAAPDTGRLDHPEHDVAYLDAIIAVAATTAAAAFDTARPSILSWGVGASRLAVVRDEVRDGRAVVGWDQSAIADDTLLVGRLTDAAGAVRAIIVNYACHPTVLGWQNTLVSPDFVGALRREVELKHPEAICLFIQGASGELAPAEQYSSDLAAADRAGRSLALSTLACLELMPSPGERPHPAGVVESGTALGVWRTAPHPTTTATRRVSTTIILERKHPSLSSIDTGIDDLRAAAEREARASRVGALTGDELTIAYDLTVWELGELVIVAHPGEAYSWLQRTLRDRLAPRPVVVANLTNGAGAFYLPTQAAYDTGAYPAQQTPVAPGSLERLLDAAVDLATHREHDPSSRTARSHPQETRHDQ
jgi:hypothetical protein